MTDDLDREKVTNLVGLKLAALQRSMEERKRPLDSLATCPSPSSIMDSNHYYFEPLVEGGQEHALQNELNVVGADGLSCGFQLLKDPPGPGDPPPSAGASCFSPWRDYQSMR